MPTRPTFDDKSAARAHVWSAMREARVARFPFPIRGRIPNFAGAERAAERLFELEPFASARAIKCNPDSPQRPVRERALRLGIQVYLPTPRLTGGFHHLDPNRIPPARLRDASVMSKALSFADPVALDDLPQLDAIICGSVAVTEDGRRCGKGHGFADLENAILHELGHAPVPMATTVHELQVVEGFPWESTDVRLQAVVTPEDAYETGA
ncbi:MAG: 5-formyltetrahydrofolate cyclo-ligase, partial [Planctomycetota bacterium]